MAFIRPTADSLNLLISAIQEKIEALQHLVVLNGEDGATEEIRSMEESITELETLVKQVTECPCFLGFGLTIK